MFKVGAPKKTLTAEDILFIQKLTKPRIYLVFFTVLSGLVYFSWRITTLNHNALFFSVVFLLLELIGFVTAVAFIYANLRFIYRQSNIAKRGLAVDVVIPTYNESLDILKKTVTAAINIDYPHETWLLDDGNREEVSQLARELGCHYLTRTNNVHAKAGNLNNAMPYLKGDFIAFFDADDIAHPSFLDKTLGYFDDEKIAIVQVPQEFYNLNSYQHLSGNNLKNPWDETSLFYRIIMPARDCRNVVMFCGSSGVIRRAALDEVGGFATGTLTEDLQTSIRIHAAGWSSASHAETLSAGYAPCEPYSFLRQRLRWAQGSLQVFMTEKPLLNRLLSKGQRFAYGMQAVAHFERARASLLYFIPPFTLMTGIAPVSAELENYLIAFIPYYLFSLLAFKEFSRGQSSLLGAEVYNFARCHTSIVALGGLVKRNIGFWVTPKGEKISLTHFLQPFLLLPIAIFTFNVLGLLNAWVFHWVVIGTPGWGSLLIISGWSLYGLIPAIFLMLHTVRCARIRNDKPIFSRADSLILHPESGQDTATSIAARVRHVNVEHMVAEVTFNSQLKLNSTVFLNMRLMHKDYALTGKIVDLKEKKQLIKVIFDWQNPQSKEAFDLALHIAQIEALSEYDQIDHITYLKPFISIMEAMKVFLSKLKRTQNCFKR